MTSALALPVKVEVHHIEY